MENASKALIIAGAILLSILIIGIGMFIYTQAAGIIGDTKIDTQKVRAYNSEFEQYEGTRSGTDVRALCDLVRDHNNAYPDDFTRNTTIASDTDYDEEDNTATPPTEKVTASVPNNVKKTVKAGKTYKVSFGYDTSSGYIVAVGITEVAAGSGGGD